MPAEPTGQAGTTEVWTIEVKMSGGSYWHPLGRSFAYPSREAAQQAYESGFQNIERAGHARYRLGHGVLIESWENYLPGRSEPCTGECDNDDGPDGCTGHG